MNYWLPIRIIIVTAVLLTACTTPPTPTPTTAVSSKVTYTQFDELSQLPDNAAYTLAEGTALIVGTSAIDEQ